MAKFQLNSGETLIGSGMMSIYLKQGLSKKPFQGNIYITNQRVCFKISMMPDALDMDLPLEDIRGFSVSGVAIFTQVTIHSRKGETYSFTGFPAKKLQDWMAQLGVQKL
jgi:hypothetical protein